MDYHIPYASIHARDYLSWVNAPLYHAPSSSSPTHQSHQDAEDYCVKIIPYQSEEEKR